MTTVNPNMTMLSPAAPDMVDSSAEDLEEEIEKVLKPYQGSNSKVSVKDMRRIIPLLMAHCYATPESTVPRRKMKGLWNEPPPDWPTDVLFLDPNNAQRSKGRPNKPTKEDIVPMFGYLASKYKKMRNMSTGGETYGNGVAAGTSDGVVKMDDMKDMFGITVRESDGSLVLDKNRLVMKGNKIEGILTSDISKLKRSVAESTGETSSMVKQSQEATGEDNHMSDDITMSILEPETGMELCPASASSIFQQQGSESGIFPSPASQSSICEQHVIECGILPTHVPGVNIIPPHQAPASAEEAVSSPSQAAETTAFSAQSSELSTFTKLTDGTYSNETFPTQGSAPEPGLPILDHINLFEIDNGLMTPLTESGQDDMDISLGLDKGAVNDTMEEALKYFNGGSVMTENQPVNIDSDAENWMLELENMLRASGEMREHETAVNSCSKENNCPEQDQNNATHGEQLPSASTQWDISKLMEKGTTNCTALSKDYTLLPKMSIQESKTTIRPSTEECDPTAMEYTSMQPEENSLERPQALPNLNLSVQESKVSQSEVNLSVEESLVEVPATVPSDGFMFSPTLMINDADAHPQDISKSNQLLMASQGLSLSQNQQICLMQGNQPTQNLLELPIPQHYQWQQQDQLQHQENAAMQDGTRKFQVDSRSIKKQCPMQIQAPLQNHSLPQALYHREDHMFAPHAPNLSDALQQQLQLSPKATHSESAVKKNTTPYGICKAIQENGEDMLGTASLATSQSTTTEKQEASSSNHVDSTRDQLSQSQDIDSVITGLWSRPATPNGQATAEPAGRPLSTMTEAERRMLAKYRIRRRPKPKKPNMKTILENIRRFHDVTMVGDDRHPEPGLGDRGVRGNIPIDISVLPIFLENVRTSDGSNRNKS